MTTHLARPGDVLMAFMAPPNKPNGGPNAHCGIMAENADVFTNDWDDGIWKRLNIHVMFDHYPYVRLIRLSERGGAAASSRRTSGK